MSAQDVYDSPEFQEWAQRVKAHVLPPLQESALTVSLVPKGDTDIKFAVELGLSIMLDKPIIAVVQPGTKVPERLIRVADAIVEADFSSPEGQAKMRDALAAALDRIRDADDA